MMPGNPGFGGNGYVHHGLPDSNRLSFGQPEKSGYRRRGSGRGSSRARSSSSSHSRHQYEERSVPRCTEFDMAYFQSYFHIGIHEEMKIVNGLKHLSKSYPYCLKEAVFFCQGKAHRLLHCDNTRA